MNEFEKLSKERKDLQKTGEVPDWMTTQGYIMFVRKYAYNNETVKGAFHRIASTLSEHYPEKTLAYSKFFNLLWKGYLSPSTPIYCNTGTDRGLVVSCAGSYIDDSISGFYNAYLENAVLSKLGFGTSSYLGDIRARGSSISIGGKADGVVPVFDSSIDVVGKVSQGSNRRGAWAGYLDIDHDDFWELTGYILKNPVDTNIGWNITEAFIEKLKNKDEEAIKRWNKILYLRARFGKGYIWKVDTANNLAPQSIKNSGISIKASNLCNEIALPQDLDHTFTCQPGFSTLVDEYGRIITMEQVEVGQKIFSNGELTRVVNKVSSGIKPVYKYKTNCGYFIGTEDHRIVFKGEKLEVRHAHSIDRAEPVRLDAKGDFDKTAVLKGLLIGDGVS